MICHKYKCLFIHIPKTAGQCIEFAFLKSLGLNWRNRSPLLLCPNHDPSKGPPRLAHLTAREYLIYEYISDELFNSYFKFSFVRNPWSRLVSEYRYRHMKCDFKTFVFKHLPNPENDCYQKARDLYRHVIPQYDFLFDDEGLQMVDFIGRFEDLQQDFDHVCHTISLPKKTLPLRNDSTLLGRFSKWMDIREEEHLIGWLNRLFPNRQRNYRYADYYDDETTEFVANLYQKDITTFGYRFEE